MRGGDDSTFWGDKGYFDLGGACSWDLFVEDNPHAETLGSLKQDC